MSILLTICARGGSKGIPGKNIKLLNGKPLIHYSLEVAQQFAQSRGDCSIAVSTDDEAILDVVNQLNVTTDYRRPAHLATDTAGKIPVLQHLLTYEEQQHGVSFDYLIDLDVTSPLRTAEDLRHAHAQLRDRPEAYNIFSVSAANRNPYFNMVEEQPDGTVDLVKRPKTPFTTRQSAPSVYDMNASFYIYRRSFFTADLPSAITSASLAYVVPHQCFDLDEPLDFDIMEFLLASNKLDFTW